MRTTMTDQLSLAGIPTGELREEYARRDLASRSDRDVVAAVARVVVLPREDPANSFVLHAPLELAARAALLPWVRADQRELARLRIVAIAAGYEAFGPPAVRSAPQTDGSLELAVGSLADALTTGDLDQADGAATTIAATAPAGSLVPRLADLVLPLTSAAAHAPIFLYQFDRVGPRGELSAELLRPLARELAREPGWRLRWLDDWEPVGPTDEEALATALEQAPLLGVPGTDFIHPLLMQVDESGTAADQLGPVVGSFSDDAARSVLRVAARSMLGEPADYAPYGWTHCLTLPQAVLGIARRTKNADRALAIAATHVLAFRAALATAPLSPLDSIEVPTVDASGLASAAATSHDAHIVKYVLGCLDAAAFDPAAAQLYLAAGQRLLDVWRDRGGDPNDYLSPSQSD